MENSRFKFRAWELSEKRMWDHHEIDFSDTNGIVMWGELFANPSKQGFAPLMQFTGLRDKNGREIYELMEINNRYVVEYLPPKYILKDISSGDIREIQEVINNENGIKVTREYTGI